MDEQLIHYCLKITYNPTKNLDGTTSDYWSCDQCGSSFIPFGLHEYLMDSLRKMNKEGWKG